MYQVWAWIKIRRKSEQSRRTLKSSWVRKSVSEANERVLEVEVEWTAKSGRGSLDEYGNECSGKEKWPARFTFAVVNKGRNETDSVLTESAVAPKERCPLMMGHQTEQVFVSWLAEQGQRPIAWASLEVYCMQAPERPTWSPQGGWQGLINTFTLQDAPWPVKNHLCSKSHSSFKLTGRKGAGCWYRVPVASRVLRVSCSSLNSPGCVLRGFFLYFISQV